MKAKKSVKYIATCDCVYNNKWTKRGTVVELPDGVAMEHSCFKVMTEDMKFAQKSNGVFYDPMADAIERRNVSDAMAGIYKP